MFSEERLRIFLDWCAANGIIIDERIHIGPDEDDHSKIGVYSGESFIPPQTTLVKILKVAVLSVRTCSLSDHIPINYFGLGAQLCLSLALFIEILKGSHSRWYGYLQSLPKGIVNMPIFWDLYDDGSEALACLRGTEADRILHQKTENNTTKLEEINRFYRDSVSPLLRDYGDLWRYDDSTTEPTLIEFYRSFSLVSSRAFLVDAFHGLSMVPVADAFNHILENNVHLESDYNVCLACGSLHECSHDHDDSNERETKVLRNQEYDDYHDLYYEMVSNTSIDPCNEIFNTYGKDLTNAQLLNQYGFILDVNDNDQLRWDISEILQSLRLDTFTEQKLGPDLSKILLYFSRDHPVFTQSQLIYFDPSAEKSFCMNDDGQLSHQLWCLLFIISSKHIQPSDPRTLISLVLDIQLRLEELCFEDDAGESLKDDNETSDKLNDLNLTGLNVLLNIARLTIALSSARKSNIGKLNSSTDEIDVNEAGLRIKAAISVVSSERSFLDSCASGWTALRKAVNSYLYNVT